MSSPSALALPALEGGAARRLARVEGRALDALCEQAAAVRDAAFGAAVTFSPKVFLPVTNLCRNACTYCSFRRSPGDPGEWTMAPDEVLATLDGGAALGCTEALLCLGDTPETSFPAYHALLRGWGHGGTVDYLAWIGERALERGILPHTNAGILPREAIARLARVNASQGLMVESTAERLCEAGEVHARAPDKHPRHRLRMLEDAGEERVAFTTGLLLGIGETPEERVDTLLAIAAAHARHGHVQEVIVQPFRVGTTLRDRDRPDAADDDLRRTLALARLVLPVSVSVQAPPNLAVGALEAMVAAGLDDLGGISPLTPDYINPAHPWPHLLSLAERLAAIGHRLTPRLPVPARLVEGYVRPELHAAIAAAPARWARLPGVGASVAA